MSAIALYLVLLWTERPTWLKYHWRRLAFLGTLMVVLASCFACASNPARQRQAFPGVPPSDSLEGLLEFPPPPWYPRWWANVEGCSGYKGDLSRLHFYVASQPFLRFSSIPGLFLGMYFRDREWIILGLVEPGDSVVVHHEMLHALRAQNNRMDEGGSAHGKEDFVERCGKVVGPVYGSH